MFPQHTEYRCRDHPYLGWMRGWEIQWHWLESLPTPHHGSPEERRMPDTPRSVTRSHSGRLDYERAVAGRGSAG